MSFHQAGLLAHHKILTGLYLPSRISQGVGKVKLKVAFSSKVLIGLNTEYFMGITHMYKIMHGMLFMRLTLTKP